MSFGQSAPPATAKQVQYLLSLVQQAGHVSFRDARGPLGLTQRQAGGKFSRDEAAVFIDQLVTGEHGGATSAGSDFADMGERISADEQLRYERIDVLRGMPAQLLADELVRRGWQVSSTAG